MYSIEQQGILRRKPRLVAQMRLSESDFADIAKRLRKRPKKARKVGMVAARKAERTERIETRWNGKESANTAEAGDWIVTNLAPDAAVLRDSEGSANTYVIKANRFGELYERAKGANDFGDLYRARGVVEAVFLSGGFEIMAPWGEVQTAATGYLLRNGADIYGNNKETFESTYKFVDT